MSVKPVLYTFKSKVWLYPGMAGWHFLSVPKKEATEIKLLTKHMKRGWGSVRVEVTVGNSVWQTSIFPDATSGTYLLPLKALIRRKEGIEEEDIVTVYIELVDTKR